MTAGTDNVDKSEWRQRMLAVRAEVQGEERTVADMRIRTRLVDLVDAHRALRHSRPVIALYVAFRGEVDVWPAATSLNHAGFDVALPRTAVATRRLDFYRVQPLQPLRPGPYGILEPDVAPSAQPVQLEELAAIVTPVVAFTHDGFRIGYGGGYYDRLFARLSPDVVRIGAAFAIQRVNTAAFPQAHDVPLHYVVTERGVIDCGTREDRG